MQTKASKLTVQRWGNSLAVRIPAAIARRAHFKVGTAVKINLEPQGVSLKTIKNTRLTLDEKLALFDPQTHVAEVMAYSAVGLESLK